MVAGLIGARGQTGADGREGGRREGQEEMAGEMVRREEVWYELKSGAETAEPSWEARRDRKSVV